ncbi:MAG: hypothetical protein GF320_14405, partial [Armatimonadia bacterium]|nr:hypothetical protein [Armatimonadia bacterium]
MALGACERCMGPRRSVMNPMSRAIRWTFLLAILLIAGTSHAAELRALVLSGANNHDWRTTTPEIVAQLRATGLFEVDVTNEPGQLSRTELDRYDVLVSDYNGPAWSDATRAAVLEYLGEGGGLVIVHAADNAFPGWTEYESLIGVAWRAGAGHGTYHRYMVTIDDPSHPVLEGIPHFLHAPDELYHSLTWGEGSEAEVIASAYSRPEESGTGSIEPLLLINRWGEGRMFHTAMGHNVQTLQGFYHTLILQRGTEWAARGRITQALPGDMPRESWVDPEADEDAKMDQWTGLGVADGLAESIVGATGPEARVSALLRVLETDAPAAHTVARQKLVWMGADAVGAMIDAAGTGLKDALQTDLTIMANRSPQVVDALVEHAKSDLLAERSLALGALAEAKEPGAVDLFVELLNDPGMADLALEVIAETPGREATEALIRETRRADDETLIRLLVALGARGDRRAAPVLVRH